MLLIFEINLFLHVVDGEWSSWTYGPCSKTCGGGIQTLTRKCNNPKPDCGGNTCYGSSYRQKGCNPDCCPGKIMYNLMCAVKIMENWLS